MNFMSRNYFMVTGDAKISREKVKRNYEKN